MPPYTLCRARQHVPLQKEKRFGEYVWLSESSALEGH